jgi:TPR repeat protein/serine/threonine protein kinase
MLNPRGLTGKRIDEYVLDEFISADELGVFYRASDLVRNRTVALRLISRTEDTTPAMAEFRNRFLESVQGFSRLSHHNILTVLSSGETEDFQYIVMEYAAGKTLAEMPGGCPMLPPDEAIPIFMQVSEALEAAAGEGIIHFNIKPASILITEGGRVKVLDFGMVKRGHLFTNSDHSFHSNAGYMSPEQVRGEKGDTRSDIFSLGAVFYHVLTGSRPFEAKSTVDLVYSILHVEPVSPRILNERISPAVEAVILRALSKDPSQRYGTPGDLRQALHLLIKEPLEKVKPVETAGFNSGQTSAVVPKHADEAREESGLDSASTDSDEPESGELEPDELDFDLPPDGRITRRKQTPLQDRIWSILAFLAIGAVVFLVLHPGHEAKRQPPVSSGQPAPKAGVPAPPTPQADFETGRKHLDGTEAKKDPQQAFVWFQKAALQGYAPAQNMVGMLYARGEGVERNDREAVQWYRKAAGQGDPEAQANLGYMCEQGYGTPRNYQEARDWYKKAADQGNAYGQNSLGDMYRFGRGVEKNYWEALRWYQKAADAGNASGQTSLGIMYQFGLGAEKNYQEALQWYRKAADQGSALARFNLGNMYRDGLGVEKNYREALEWYRKAADQGYADAQVNVGFMLQKGYGIQQDYREAAIWFRKAAEQGNAVGQSNLGFMYKNGFGVEKNYQEAVQWYRKAAEQGNAAGQNSLGVMYQFGLGIGKDYQEAVQWYRKAADQGNANGQLNMGSMYRDGNAVGQNYREALNWYRKAAEQEHVEALYNIGNFYENGFGIDKDLTEAVRWYQKAADKGNKEAAEALKRLQ